MWIVNKARWCILLILIALSSIGMSYLLHFYDSDLFSGGLNVVDVSYSLKTVRIDNANSFQSAIFTISFDEGIKHEHRIMNTDNYAEIQFVNATGSITQTYDQLSLSNITSTDTPPLLCFPPLACTSLPQLSANLRGVFRMHSYDGEFFDCHED